MDYFYDNKTDNDELICGPCGFQFIYTVHYDKAQYPKWLELNEKWVRDAGFHVGSLWWTRYPSPAYEQYTQSTSLDGLFHNFNNIGSAPILSNGVGLFREFITECRSTDYVYRDLAAVPANPEAPEFRAQKVIQPEFMPNGYAMLKSVVDRLQQDFPGKYVFMRPSDFAATAKAHARPLPALPKRAAPTHPKNITQASFAVDDTDSELRFMHENQSNGIHQDHRFADLRSSWTYKFDLADTVKVASATLTSAGTTASAPQQTTRLGFRFSLLLPTLPAPRRASRFPMSSPKTLPS